MADWRLSVDIGGTFTDAVLLDAASAAIFVAKSLTTPATPLNGVQRAVLGVLAKAGVEPHQVSAPVVHATTLVTNALIEGKVARAALVTTSGFADTLLIRDEHRYDMYDLQIEFPQPPISRDLTFEINERTMADGSLVTTPDDEELSALATTLRGRNVEAVAVCLLHSYANPTNERRVAERLRAGLGDLPVCTSCEVAPQIREYPRMVTTACNAATMPLTGRYLGAFRRWLAEAGFGGSLLVMLSNGGVVSADDAIRTPIRLVESGPAAGALAGMWYARHLDRPRLLCLDMGGTTAKSCLIEDYQAAMTPDFEVARVYRFKKGSGFPITVPSVDLVEIGAGGGSIAHVDDLGLLKVGPESAGAEPGPVCYGLGGTQPTVTDADVILGHIDPKQFLGGDMPLNRDAAEDAIGKLAEVLDATPDDSAAGVREVVDQNMAASTRMHAVERGADLRGVPLIAFGGAGPVHACGVAELLGSPEVVFPANASVLSAFGALVTPVRIDLARSLLRLLHADVDAEVDTVLAEMRDEGRRVLTGAGVPPEEVRYNYGVDARYLGQGNEITLWVGEGDAWPITRPELVNQFTREYTQVYGMSISDVPIEIVTWRVSATTSAPAVSVTAPDRAVRSAGPPARRDVRFHRGRPPTATPVYARAELAADDTVTGPALIEERETTIVLRPDWTARMHGDGSLVAVRTK